jgi:hypothetical protein
MNDKCSKLKENIWTDEQELILKTWSDIASCYKLMHDKSHKKYWCLNAWFSIPIIIFSTLTGTGNFSQESFSYKSKQNLIIVLGSINLLSAVLLSIKAFLNVAERSESHRLSSIGWSKFGRKIRVELSKQRKHRKDSKLFMNTAEEDYNRLIEGQLTISTDIIRWFNQLIEDGEYDFDKAACQICLNDWFCFPCGLPFCECICNKRLCNILFCCGYCEDKEKTNKKINIVKDLHKIELPEIVGRIHPTKISKNNVEENEYRIYEDSNV